MDKNKVQEFLRECSNLGESGIIEVSSVDSRVRFDSKEHLEVYGEVLVCRGSYDIFYIDIDSITRLSFEIL